MPESPASPGHGREQPAPSSSVAVAQPPAHAGTLQSGLQRVFSFPVMLAFMLALLAVFTVRSRFDDPDMWWHMKMGEIIWTTHTIPLHDIFSYTTNHQASVPQEWLGEVSLYLAYKLGGYSGLMLWICIFASAIFIGGYALCSFYSGNLKIAFVGGVLVWLFSTIGLSARPQMIGYLLLVVELFLIQLGRTRNPRWFLCLPILFALWINCHGSFFLGIVIAGIFLVSSFVHFQAGSLLAPQWDPARRRILGVALLLSIAALFLNPDGIHQVLYPANAFLTQRLALAASQEWQPTSMSDPRALALLLILLCSFLTVVLRRAELYFDELLILAAATWLGLGHQRTLFAFGILAAPVLCRQLAGLWEGYDRTKDPHWLNAIFMAGALLAMIYMFPSAKNLSAETVAKSPVKAVAFIKNHHLAGPMLNDYGFGGYLIWAAPKYPVMIDGRADVYEWSGFFGEYERWATLESSPKDLLDKYNVNFCLLASHSPMVQAMSLVPGWKMVYSDQNSVIYLRETGGHGFEK
ncbi:MAG TPA: hypothetical protein VGR47_22960 [Terracidiphilus sp.]|nr:hypothetical protein [Terracidiphilus sp.]